MSKTDIPVSQEKTPLVKKTEFWVTLAVILSTATMVIAWVSSVVSIASVLAFGGAFSDTLQTKNGCKYVVEVNMPVGIKDLLNKCEDTTSGKPCILDISVKAIPVEGTCPEKTEERDAAQDEEPSTELSEYEEKTDTIETQD